MSSLATNPARIRRREAILAALDAAEPDPLTTLQCRSAARCTEGEAIVELLWLARKGHVEATKAAYGMRWRVVRSNHRQGERHDYRRVDGPRT